MIDTGIIDRFVADHAVQHRCPSIAWGLLLGGRLVATGSTGSVHGAAPSSRTVYRIASMTKSFSAAAVLALRDEGFVVLDRPIADDAPELASVLAPTSDSPPVTVRHLLTMAAGLATDDPWADRHLDLDDAGFDSVVRGGLRFNRVTGPGFDYSNFGFALLGRVVHRITGERLQDHVTRRLLGPLGLRRTTWVRPDHGDWAPPVRDDGDDEVPSPGDGTIAPMGGLWSTVDDIATWMAWLADAFPARDGADGPPLRRSSRREMQTPATYVGHRSVRGTPVPTSYGYGIRILDDPRHGIVLGHSGGLPGYGSNMRWTPGGAVGIVSLSNVTYASMSDLNARLHDLVVDEGWVDRVDPPVDPDLLRLGDDLITLLNAWATGGGDAAPIDLDRLFADNVLPDRPIAARTAAAVGHGPIDVTHRRPDGRATLTLTGTDRSGRTMTVRLTLAPVEPARIQDYEVTVHDGNGRPDGG